MAAPTTKQLNLLRKLAIERGATFVWPADAAAASRQIEALMGRRRSDRIERMLDARGIIRDGHALLPSSSVRADEETEGYGSSARWKGGRS